jgi:TolB protein
MSTRRMAVSITQHVVLVGILLLGGWACTDSGVDVTTAPTGGSFAADKEPAWSPGGEWIAYVHTSVDPNDTTYPSGLYLIDTSGAQRHLVLAGVWVLSPAWSPDGSRIAFSAGGAEIMTITPEGEDLRQLTNTGEAFFPSWSPDGKRLAFDTDYETPQGGNAIWLINSDGTGLKDISEHGTGEWRDAAWSPDGTRLVHYRYIGIGTTEIFVMDTAGFSPQRLTYNSTEDLFPGWSPDGRTISWSRVETRTSSVNLIDSDGRSARRLTEGSMPAWSPDSQQIVFTRLSPAGDRFVLWTIAPDGTGLRQLTR